MLWALTRGGGGQHLLGAWRLFKLVLGSVKLVFSDVQGYKKTCYFVDKAEF